MRDASGTASRRRAEAPQAGFATATVIVLLVLSIVGGAFVLKLTRSQASATGGYYQARAANLAAQAGLEGALAQLESDPAGGVALLNGYLADTTRQWLLGNDGARTERRIGDSRQRYAVRIAAFDPEAGLVKLEGIGEGPGGSASRAQGVYRLGGVAVDRPTLAKYAWYMAGEARNVDQPVEVLGDAYFGGGVHFNGGSDGSILYGSVKIARGAGVESSFDGRILFSGTTYVQTPLRSQGGGMRFGGNAGFEANLSLDTDTEWMRTGLTVHTNASVTGGNARLDVDGNRVVHSGSLNTARVANASRITSNGGPIDIGRALGMEPGPESEVSIDLASVPANRRFTPAGLGLARGAGTNGPELSAAYAAALARGDLHRGFLVVDVAAGLDFMDVPGNFLRGKFLFNVTAPVTVNQNLPESDPTSVSLWYFGRGGSATGFGGRGLFRGYVHVAANGNVIYQWAGGCEFQGAIHHVSRDAGFQLNGSAGPLRLTFSAGVFEELAALGVMAAPGAPGPGPGTPQATRVKLVDVKIRPRLMGRYF